MAGYQPSGNAAQFIDDATHEFFKIVQSNLKFQDKTRINWVPITPQHSDIVMMNYGEPENVVIELVSYSDYFDIREDQLISEIAMKAAMGASGAYNALLGAAMRKYGYGVYATELLQPSDNLVFTLRMNSGPSVADPCGLLHGWAAWRFRFGAGAKR